MLQTAVGFLVFRPVRALARMLQAAPFSARETETLTSIAEIVLPSDLTAQERKRVVDRFDGHLAGAAIYHTTISGHASLLGRRELAARLYGRRSEAVKDDFRTGP